jgi:hypothetical protein
MVVVLTNLLLYSITASGGTRIFLVLYQILLYAIV